MRKTHVVTKKRKVTPKPDNAQLKFSFSIPEFAIPLTLTESVVDTFMSNSHKEDADPSVQRMYM